VHQGVLDSTGRLFSVDSIAFDEGELKFPQVKAALTVSAYVYGDGIPDPLPEGATSSASTSAVGPIASAQQAASDAEQAQNQSGAGTQDTQPIPPAPSGA